jgi:hypothetical protein
MTPVFKFVPPIPIDLPMNVPSGYGLGARGKKKRYVNELEAGIGFLGELGLAKAVAPTQIKPARKTKAQKRAEKKQKKSDTGLGFLKELGLTKTFAPSQKSKKRRR